MVKWYDRIGNTIEMNIDNQWVKGTIVNGYRTHDGLINMKTEDGKNCWCGVNGEHIHFRKCDDSLGDLLTNADKMRSMTDEELAKQIMFLIQNAFAFHLPSEEFSKLDLSKDEEIHLDWLKGEYKESLTL